MPEQLHAGRRAGKPIWHSRDDGPDLVYWTGYWGERTPLELYLECLSTLADLARNHPELPAALYPPPALPPTPCG